MDRQARRAHNIGTASSFRAQRGARVAFAAFVLALAGVDRAAADVNSSGDVSPSFPPAPVVDLSGQRLFIGNTVNGVGTVGTVNVTGGGVLTAAQIDPGVGGLGIGFVNVTGAGSIIHLTGGAPSNGLDIGSWGTGVVTVAGGGQIVCASVAACPFNDIGNGAGSTGTLAINGGAVSGLGSLAVGLGALAPGFGTPGAATTATLSITNGGTLSSMGGSSVANNIGQTGRVTGNVTIDGAGSKWTISRDLAGGGNQAGLALAPTANSLATMTLSNGASLAIQGSRSNPATDNSLPFLGMSVGVGATSTLTVTSGASILFSGDTGALNVGGNQNSGGGTATLNVTGGGTVSGSGSNGLTFVGIGRTGATGTVNISGAGSQLAVAGVGGQNTQGLDGIGGLVLVGGANGVSGTLNVSSGGSLLISDNGLVASAGSMGLRVATGSTGVSGTVTVSGAGSSIVVTSTSGDSATTPSVLVGNGGNAQMTISNGATVSVLGAGQRNFTVNNAATGSGVLNMSNGATVVASRFAVADNGGNGVATVDHSTINVDGVVFFNGAPIGAAVRVGRGVGANGVLNLQNGAAINVANTIDSASVILGGTNSLAGGTGTLNMSGGSSINFTGTAANASLQVGGTQGTGFMTMGGGSTVNVGLTGNASVGATAGSAGTLTVGGGSTITANTISIGGTSDTAAGGNGSATVTGAGSALIASGGAAFFGVGRSGTGSLTVNTGAMLSGTSFSLGRSTGGFGNLVVDQATVNLSGQQTETSNNVGATLSIGLAGGSGIATLSNGSVLTISNPGTLGASLNLGGRVDPPAGGGSGVLNVTGSQINVLAAPGQAAVRIGYDGTGIATLSGSTLNVGNPTASGADGALAIAAQPTSTGVLTLNGGTVVNAGYVGVGATTAGPGGNATLILNNSTINTTTFEIGAAGLLSGDGGVINAAGDVVVAGTISPGNSPGRLTIHCNLITLPGSLLILDVLGTGGGFSLDHLIIGNNATFSLHDLHIVFNFLGDTDPNAFAASGGFDLDNFLQSLDLASGSITGLSNAFAPGQTWDDVVDPAAISAVSSVYDISNLQIQPDGSVSVVAVPVPEPETWAILLIGLLTLAATSRRRAGLRRR
jgi:T5SS/PEP-CTERM-associated repeat protein